MATNVSKTFKRTFASSAIRNQLKDVVIVGAARTPMGSFRGYDVLYTLINLNIRSSYFLQSYIFPNSIVYMT